MKTFKTFLMCTLCVFFANFTVSCGSNFDDFLPGIEDMPESSIQRVIRNVLEDQNILFEHSLSGGGGEPQFKNNEIDGTKWYYFIDSIEKLLAGFDEAFTIARDPADFEATYEKKNTRGDGFSTYVFAFNDSGNLMKSYLLPHSVLSNSIQTFIKESLSMIHVVMPNSLMNIPNNFFKGNTKIRSFTALGLADVGRFSFANCSVLEEVIFDTLVSIRKSAFSGCSKLTSISFSDLLGFVDDNVFFGAPIQTLDLIGERLDSNNIREVCDVLLHGYPNTVDTGLSNGQIKTFKFSLSENFIDECTDLIAYINEVLSLNKANIDLLSGVESGTLDLASAEISDISATFANYHGGLIDTIKSGNKTYTLNTAPPGWGLVG